MGLLLLVLPGLGQGNTESAGQTAIYIFVVWALLIAAAAALALATGLVCGTITGMIQLFRNMSSDNLNIGAAMSLRSGRRLTVPLRPMRGSSPSVKRPRRR